MALLNSEAVEKLHGHLTEQLVKDGKSPVRTITELYEIIVTFLIQSRFRLSTNSAYKQFMILLQQNEKIIMTSAERLTEMLTQFHGYDVSRRSGYDSTENSWMKQKKSLRKMEIIEEKMFQPSVNILMSRKSDELFLDDELIGSWSSDVECKTLSYRKSGKERPVADAIADI
jgi:hypothetical protein